MMRIKEAIQRRRLIQQLNDEYAAIEDDANLNSKNSASTLLGPGSVAALDGGHNTLAYIMRKKKMLLRDADALGDDTTSCGDLTDHHRAYLRLHDFVNELNQHLSDAQIFENVLSDNPGATSVFYRSAFVKCIEERRTGCPSGTIATIRDHAHLLIDLVDGIMCVMFDTPFHKPVWDPATIGRAHAKYIPMGFDPNIWQKLGECFAEIMFSQECIRAYPHAASAWSTLSVVVTDKMYSQTIRAKNADLLRPYGTYYGAHSTTSFNNQKQGLAKNSSLNSIALAPCDSTGSAPLPSCPSHTNALRTASVSAKEPIPLHMMKPRKIKNHSVFSADLNTPAVAPTFSNTAPSKSHRRKAFHTNKLEALCDDSPPAPIAVKPKLRNELLLLNKSSSSNDSTDSNAILARNRRLRMLSPTSSLELTQRRNRTADNRNAQNNSFGSPERAAIYRGDKAMSSHDNIPHNSQHRRYVQSALAYGGTSRPRQINAILRQPHFSTSGESTDV